MVIPATHHSWLMQGNGFNLPLIAMNSRWDLIDRRTMDSYQAVKLPVILAVSLVLSTGCEQTQFPVAGPRAATVPAPAGDTTGKTVLLDAVEARRQATAFINQELGGHTSRGPTGDVAWQAVAAVAWHSVIYDYRKKRILLRLGGSGGWAAQVTMGPNGEPPPVEHVEFAWD